MEGKFVGKLEGILNSVKKKTKIGILLAAAGVNIVNFNNLSIANDFNYGKLKIINKVYDYDFDNGSHNTTHYLGGEEGPDSFDRYYDNIYFPPSGKITKIVSKAPLIPNNELMVDVRPTESLTPVNLELAIHTQWEGPLSFSNLKNELWCSFRVAEWTFGNKPITLWERTIIDPNSNPNDPNNYTISLLADVREVIDRNRGIVPLLPLNGTHGSEIPYMYAQVRFNTFPGDFDLRSRVDLVDFAIMAENYGKTDVNSIADISGPNGIPDKAVDIYDLALFTRDYLKDSNDPNTW